MTDQTELTPCQESRRAAISPAVNVDEATLARLLTIINRRHARRELGLDDVYIFPGTPSNQRIDHYGTRMAPSSLANYQANIREGIALMNSHRTGGFLSDAELPVGRIFEAELQGEAIQVGGAEFDERSGQELLAWHYMLRDVKVTDIANNDLIRAIDGGTIKDESIGFTLRPDGQMTCSICGNNYNRYDECPHIAFGEYENADGMRHRAFVWVERARLVEASLVYEGATPGAMIRKAQTLAESLPHETLDYLEDHYQVRLLPKRTLPVVTKQSRRKEEPMERTAIIEILEEQLGEERAAELAAIEDDSEFAARAAEALADQTRDIEADNADLAGEVDRLTPLAAIGERYRDDLVTQAVEARVRAQGADFDAERYRGVLAGTNDLDFIRGEAEAWQARAEEVLQAGPGQTRRADPEGPTRAPASAYS